MTLHARRQRRGSTTKPWFCDVISTLPVVWSSTGWLPPWWPNDSFDGAAAEREAEDLVAEADAEHRLAARAQLARRGDAVVDRGRIAGAVRQEEAVGAERERVARRASSPARP